MLAVRDQTTFYALYCILYGYIVRAEDWMYVVNKMFQCIQLYILCTNNSLKIYAYAVTVLVFRFGILVLLPFESKGKMVFIRDEHILLSGSVNVMERTKCCWK